MQWQPFREPVRATIVRNGAIALVAGAVSARWWGGMSRWPIATLLMLWPSFGGHFVEIWFLNWLRPRLPDARAAQVLARLAVWFVAGIAIVFGMRMTAQAVGRSQGVRWPASWFGGLAFIGIELVAQSLLQLRRRPNFFNGLG